MKRKHPRLPRLIYRFLYPYLDTLSTKALTVLLQEHLESDCLTYYSPIIRHILKVIEERTRDECVCTEEDMQRLKKICEEVGKKYGSETDREAD